MFDNEKFEAAATAVAHHYEKSAPVIADWCDWLMTVKPKDITMADILLLQSLDDPTQAKMTGNHAANRLYKHQDAHGRDTTGMAGF